jgi:hypothetical protein
LNLEIVVAIAIDLSVIAGVLLGWRLRALRPCSLPHGPFIRVPDGGIGIVKVSGNVELGPGFAHVDQGGQLSIELSNNTNLLPGDHDLSNVTIRSQP